jgi:hypothetical protein
VTDDASARKLPCPETKVGLAQVVQIAQGAKPDQILDGQFPRGRRFKKPAPMWLVEQFAKHRSHIGAVIQKRQTCIFFKLGPSRAR